MCSWLEVHGVNEQRNCFSRVFAEVEHPLYALGNRPYTVFDAQQGSFLHAAYKRCDRLTKVCQKLAAKGRGDGHMEVPGEGAQSKRRDIRPKVQTRALELFIAAAIDTQKVGLIQLGCRPIFGQVPKSLCEVS